MSAPALFPARGQEVTAVDHLGKLFRASSPWAFRQRPRSWVALAGGRSGKPLRFPPSLLLSLSHSARLCFSILHFSGRHGMGLTGWKSWLRGQRDGGPGGRWKVCDPPPPHPHPPKDQGMPCWWECLAEFVSALFHFQKEERVGGENKVRSVKRQEEFGATRVRGIKFQRVTEANSCGASGRAHTDSSSSCFASEVPTTSCRGPLS